MTVSRPSPTSLAPPIALGVRYAETETIRREIADRRAAIVAANEQLLTSAQSSRLRTLEEAPCIPASADYPVSRAIVVGGNATPSDLGLSSEQRAAYQTITGEFDRWHSSQQAAISRWRKAACVAIAASPLDPAAIGTPEAYIAVAERQIALRRAAHVKANQELLLPDQRARLQLLDEARRYHFQADEAESDGILERRLPPATTLALGARLEPNSCAPATDKITVATPR
jgi:Spy/CpxP family protein refolding chaperone